MTEQQAFDYLLAFYIAEVRGRSREFEESASVKNALMRVARTLTMDSHKFGCIFLGTCGTGKSTLIYAMQKMVNVLKIQDYTDVAGIRVEQAVKIAARRDFADLMDEDVLAIDDFGLEPVEVLHYGNSISPISDLLEYRYNRMKYTILSTNLTPKDIRKKYGDRIADRLNEMMDRITFGGKSFRM